MHKPLWLIVVLVVGILAVLIFSVATGALPANALSPVACTMDAKLCPDGSYVGRDGNNNCEWQQCPGEEEANCEPYVCANGKTHPRCTDDGTVINYFAAPCHMDGGETDACTPDECGESQIMMPNWMCPDGSAGGPACMRSVDGTCGWRVRDCPNDSGFSDVPTSHENSDAIFYVKSHGLVHGYEDGTYKPDNTINRAEFMKILMSSLDDDGPVCKIAPFSDVDQTAWYATFAHKARCRGIVAGYLDGTFKPMNAINLAEAAKIIVNAERVQQLPLLAEDGSATVPESDPWYEQYVMALALYNAIPTSITSFDQNITRGEMAEMIYRLRMGSGGKPSRTYEELR